MLINILEKENLVEFFEAMQSYGEVVAPVRATDNAHRFQPVKGIDELDLDYTRTMIPPKKYFIQPKETLFTFNKEKEKYLEPPSIDKSMVLLGVHACDINAMNLLARVFMEELPDKYYLERRKNSVIVGVSCTPDEKCFCKSTGTDYAQEGFELFLHDIGDKYLVRVGSLKGHNIVKDHSELFAAPEKGDLDAFKEAEKTRLSSFTIEIEMSGLQDHLDMSYDDPLWAEYAEKCLGCGSCNLVCPRCRCYDVQDYINLDMNTGERVRMWYSCMLKDHGLVAGGHNFRPTSMERLRNRINCKGSLREEMPNCVGCGRCTVFCPADIDFVEILQKVRGDIK
ncbi:MAG: 4Fe-4S dicluster domain-containing protein [Candidatus Bathyarchaeota archaeon]|nr:4Fe-4S dicluster domain-containing protein [Candidatus Bathyarchaeota archaeon]